MGVIGVGVAIFYSVAAWNNQFVFDDHIVIEGLPAKVSGRELAGLFGEPHYLNFLYYRPVTRATLAIQRGVWGIQPRAFHVFNAGLAGFVFIAVYLLLRSGEFGIGALAAGLGALWVAVHPATSECVYPAASGRESLMPMFFIPLGMWMYLKNGWGWFAGAMFVFVLGLLSKEQAVVLGGMFFVGDLIWRRDRAMVRWAIVVAVLAGYFVLRHFIFSGRSIHLDFWEHPGEVGLSILYGVQTVVLPFGELRYEPPFEVWFSGWRVVVAGIFLVGVVVAVWKVGIWRAGVFWGAWFVLMQLPTAHLVAEQEAGYSERYVALAGVGFAAVVAGVVSRVKKPRVIGACAATAVLWVLGMGVISFGRGQYYSDDFAFDGQWERTNPKSSVAHSGLGVAYEKMGETDNAVAEYEAALACSPGDWTANDNLGVILLHRGDYWEAEKHLRVDIEAEIHDPQIMVNYGIALEMLGVQQKNAGFRDAGKSWFEAVIKSNPGDANAHFELGMWERRFGDKKIAEVELGRAYELDPGLRGLK